MNSALTVQDSYTINISDLIREGRARAAVDLLDHAGHPDPRGVVGRIQLEQRAEAFTAADKTGDKPWPRQTENLLAPPGTIPEISAAELNARTLTDGVVGSGSLIVRGLVSEEEAALLRIGIDAAMDGRDRAEKGEDPTEGSGWYLPLHPGLPKFAMHNAFHTVDSPVMAFEVSDLYYRLGVVDVMADYLYERPSLSLRKWVLRRVPVDATGGWHQDGNFLGAETRNMNLWIGLTDNGVTAPGLALVPLRIDHIVESGTGDAHFDWSVGTDVVERILGKHTIAVPDLKEGDAVFFDGLCLHASALTPQMTETRYAIESWFFAPSHFPADYEGFLL